MMRRLALSALVACLAWVLPGCVLGELVGGMAESAHREGSTDIPAEYTGVAGHSFAAVASVDRATQARYPTLASEVIGRVNSRLAQSAGATGWVPPDQIIAYLNNNPSWPAWSRERLAEEFGVERLIIVELAEYRLNETGNQYLWDGVAAGTVTVHEADAYAPEFEVFSKEIRVSFPDQRGYGPEELPEAAVATELLRRFVDRVVWVFYDHEEANVIPY